MKYRDPEKIKKDIENQKIVVDQIDDFMGAILASMTHAEALSTATNIPFIVNAIADMKNDAEKRGLSGHAFDMAAMIITRIIFKRTIEKLEEATNPEGSVSDKGKEILTKIIDKEKLDIINKTFGNHVKGN